MKNLLILLMCCFMASAQEFIITRDTVEVSIPGRISPGIINKGRYCCFFETSNMPYSTDSSKRFYTIAADGVAIGNTKAPKELSSYYDLHVRQDSVVVKAYMEAGSFYFNPVTQGWQPIKDVDDRIYEDNDFYVTSLDFGEWGGTIWFRDKKTGNEYMVNAHVPQVTLLNGVYYLTLAHRVMAIDNPRKLAKCTATTTYGEILKRNTIVASHYTQGVTTLYAEDAFMADYCIDGSFVANGRLYHLYTGKGETSIAVLENGKMKPVQTLGKDVEIDSYHEDYRCEPVNPVVKQFSTASQNLFGFLEIEGNRLKLHYIKNNYTVPRLDEEASWKAFLETFQLAAGTMGSLYLSQVRPLEETHNGIDLTQEHMMSVGFYPNPNKFVLETPLIYRKEESGFTEFRTSYSYTKTDGSVKSVIMEWEENRRDANTPFFDRAAVEKREDELAQVLEIKYARIAKYLTDSYGTPGQETSKTRSSLTWKTPGGSTITLYREEYKKLDSVWLEIYKD